MMVLHVCTLWVSILYDVLDSGALENLERLLSWMVNNLMRMIGKVGHFTVNEIFTVSCKICKNSIIDRFLLDGKKLYILNIYHMSNQGLIFEH